MHESPASALPLLVRNTVSSFVFVVGIMLCSRLPVDGFASCIKITAGSAFRHRSADIPA